jgi:lysophospholipase L1-like esterase
MTMNTRVLAAFTLASLTAGSAALFAQAQSAPAASSQAPAAQPPTAPASTCPEMATALTALMRNDARLADWPALGRYREANRALQAPSAGEQRVVFMGDSITDAWQQPRFSFFPGKPYVDRGISGQTTPQMLVRFRRDVIELKPKAVVILAGTNDIAGNTGAMSDEDIEANLASMSELAHANNIKVVLSSITPVGGYHTAAPRGVPQTTTRPMARIQKVNDWMKTYAGAHGDTYLDYFSAMTDQSGLMRAELTEDDLHPNAKGYEIMAPLAQAAIDKALK